jgi:oligoendopeptidase F
MHFRSGVIAGQLLLALTAAESMEGQVRERSSLPDQYTWNLADLYPSDTAWEEAYRNLDARVTGVARYRGMLASSAAQLLACLEERAGWYREFQRLASYASNKSNEDTRVPKYQAMLQQVSQLATKAGTEGSFIEPEIVAMDETVLRSFLDQEPGLAAYRFYLLNVLRRKAHMLSDKEERIVAEAGRMADAPGTIYNVMSDAELPYPEITLKDGRRVTLNKSAFSRYRAEAGRDDRELAFKAFFETFKRFESTFGAQLFAKVSADLFYARARGYGSTLEMALDPNNIPVEVYHSLIDNVNRNLPKFHRYLRLKQRMMGLDRLRYSDLYAETVEGVRLEYDVAQAQALVLDAFQPMGERYMEAVRKAFAGRWIDFFPTPGKRSGAYSNDGGYDVHPFVLLNYNGLFEDVSTLAHELGHAMHTWFSNQTQPYPTADYPIFVAEVASTFNEALLREEVLAQIGDPEIRLSLLMKYLDGLKGTLFRQTQFAEFELKIHERVERGESLTGADLSRLYGEIARRYYGHDQGVCEVQDFIDYEWAYILHFFNYTYYVYQYATSFTASTALAEMVLQGEQGAVDRVLKFLSAGGSDYPINLLREAGVDMTSSVPFDKTMQAMERTMDEIERILARRR